jgi:hypothetical protein
MVYRLLDIGNAWVGEQRSRFFLSLKWITVQSARWHAVFIVLSRARVRSDLQRTAPAVGIREAPSLTFL